MDVSDAFRQLIRGVNLSGSKYKERTKLFQKNQTHQESNQEDSDGSESQVAAAPEDDNAGSARKKPLTKAKRRNIEKERINKLRKDNWVKIKGEDIPMPIEKFDQLKKYGVKDCVLDNIEKAGFKSPTPVQMEAIPLMLKRRELICCAPTGSGKTVAFVVPLLVHLQGPQKCGFRAVILAPTRELSKQIHRECLYLAEGTGLRIHLINNVYKAKKRFGLNSKLKFDILVTTPKRLVYLLKLKPPGINIQNVEWLVIDECDKLFETSFREQLSIIYKACSESSSCSRALFSATFDKELETWFQLNLDNVVTLVVGGKNRAALSVEQKLLFVGNEDGKVIALRNLIGEGLETPVLIFVDRIEKAKQLYLDLVMHNINVDIIHAERTQEQRDSVVQKFREGSVWFLICTELMARGIDFKGVNLLINYDLPKSVTAYIHRIGRTGRAGRQGKAITFFTEKQMDSLGPIVDIMRKSNSEVPDYLLERTSKERKMQRFQKKLRARKLRKKYSTSGGSSKKRSKKDTSEDAESNFSDED